MIPAVALRRSGVGVAETVAAEAVAEIVGVEAEADGAVAAVAVAVSVAAPAEATSDAAPLPRTGKAMHAPRANPIIPAATTISALLQIVRQSNPPPCRMGRKTRKNATAIATGTAIVHPVPMASTRQPSFPKAKSDHKRNLF